MVITGGRGPRGFLIAGFVLSVALSVAQCYSTAEYDALVSKVFTNYTATTRPTEVVTIEVDFQFTTIQSVDVKNGVFAVSGWWIIMWTDGRLTWDPADHDNITALVTYEDDVWTPALVVSNSNNDLSAIDDDTIPVRVTSGGSLLWHPPAILNVACDLDITKYPFDEQECYIEVTSFGYNIMEINLTSYGGVHTMYYSTNGEWSLDGVGYQREEYMDAELTYSRIRFMVQMTRKSTYYGLNVIFPVIIMGLLTIFVFQVPPDCGEKLGYALTILLTFVVLMALVASNMPTTANYTPLLEVYIAATLGLSALSVLLSILILDIFHMNEKKPVPRRLQTFTLACQRLMCHREHFHRVESAWGSREGSRTSLRKDGMPDFSRASAMLPRPRSNGVPMHHSHRPQSPRSRPEPPTHPPITWSDVASTLDSLMMRVYLLLIVGLGLGFLLAMIL